MGHGGGGSASAGLGWHSSTVCLRACRCVCLHVHARANVFAREPIQYRHICMFSWLASRNSRPRVGGGGGPGPTLCAGRLRSFWLRMTDQMLAVLSGSAPAGSWSGWRRTRLSPAGATAAAGGTQQPRARRQCQALRWPAGRAGSGKLRQARRRHVRRHQVQPAGQHGLAAPRTWLLGILGGREPAGRAPAATRSRQGPGAH